MEADSITDNYTIKNLVEQFKDNQARGIEVSDARIDDYFSIFADEDRIFSDGNGLWSSAEADDLSQTGIPDVAGVNRKLSGLDSISVKGAKEVLKAIF